MPIARPIVLKEKYHHIACLVLIYLSIIRLSFLLILSIILYNILITFHPHSLSALNILLFILSISMGVLIWYSFEFIISSLTFFLRDFRTGGWLGHEIIKFSMRPDSIYRGFLRKILFTILPMALVASVPSRLLLYGLTPQNQKYLIVQILVVSILLILTRIFWRIGLKKYESAQSYTGPVI